MEDSISYISALNLQMLHCYYSHYMFLSQHVVNTVLKTPFVDFQCFFLWEINCNIQGNLIWNTHVKTLTNTYHEVFLGSFIVKYVIFSSDGRLGLLPHGKYS